MALKELEKPAPGDGEVLVRVLAASLAAGEYFGMRGKPFPIRMHIGFPKPKKDFVVGLDCAGIVEAVGPNVSHLRPGDEVYGECRGSCAEYALAREGGLAPKPANLSFEHAAAVPTSACTALQASVTTATSSGRRCSSTVRLAGGAEAAQTPRPAP
jgi:NADPH:quinone reductase-like Zn-dependent oxidoreductase